MTLMNSVKLGGKPVDNTDIPIEGDLVKYDSASESFTFQPGSSIALALGDLTDVTISSPTAGQVLRKGAGDFVNAAIQAGDLPSHTHAQADVTSLVSDLAAKEATANKGAISGYAGLNASQQITNNIAAESQIPTLSKSKISTSGTWVLNDLPVGTANQRLRTNSAATAQEHFTEVCTLTFIIDGGGSAITTGQKGHLEIPFGCTITGWTLLADQSGSIVIDVWKDTYANFPPTVADTIAGTEKPTLASVQKNQDLTLTTWTTAIAIGDILAFNVDSITTVTRIVLSIRCNKIG